MRETAIVLTVKIQAIYQRSHEAYGPPNIHADLADDHSIRVGRNVVWQVHENPNAVFVDFVRTGS
jgi:hypothetical protein